MLGRIGLPLLGGRFSQANMADIVAFYDWKSAYAADNRSADGVVAGELAQLATGGGFSFDGISDYVDCGDDSSLKPNGSMSIGLWVKTDDTAAGNFISDFLTTGNQRSWFLGINGSGQLQMRYSTDGVSTAVLNGDLSIINDIWHHVVFVFEASTVFRFYIDGSLDTESTSSIPAAFFTSTTDILIGARNAGVTAPADGEIAGVFVYAAAASAADILHCYNNPGALPHEAAGSSLMASDLKGHWPLTEDFQDANLTLVLDHSGSGNHGANVSGGATPISPVEEAVPQTGLRGFTRGIRFDGTDDDVTFTSAVADMRQDWSIALIAEFEDVGTARCLFSWADAGGDGVQIGTDGSGVLYARVDISGDANQTLSSSHTFAARDVAHIVVAHDVSEKTLYFYVDGAVKGSDTYTSDLPNSAATVGTIGDGVDLSNAKGLIDDVALFSALFDASAVTELYNTGDPIDATLHTTTPDGYWRNGWLTSAGTWEDLSSNDNHGTVNGTPDNVILEARPDNVSRTALGGFVRQAPGGNAFAFAEAGHARLLGSHLVTNGGFDDATGWTATSPWAISEGLATIDGSQAGNTALTQAATFTEDDYYEVTFDVVEYTAGTVTPSVNGTAGTGRTAVGRFTEVVQAGASGGFVLTANATFDGSVDIVYARRVILPDLFAGGGTVSAWIRPITIGGGGFGRIFDKTSVMLFVADPSGGDVRLRYFHTFSGVDGSWHTTPRVLTFGVWAHVCVVYNNDAIGNNPIFYINGSAKTIGSGLEETQVPTGSADSNVASVTYIGNNAAGIRDFNGDIGRIGFHDAELSASDVSRIFEAERGLYGI